MAGDPAKPGGEGAQPQNPATGEGKRDPNVHKLERDVANRDKRIRELEERLAEVAGGQKTAEERIGEIEAKLKAMADERAAAKADAALIAAGCIDCEIARPALDAPARRMISATARSQRVRMRTPRACGDHRCRQCGLTPSDPRSPHMRGLSTVLLMKNATFRCSHAQAGEYPWLSKPMKWPLSYSGYVSS